MQVYVGPLASVLMLTEPVRVACCFRLDAAATRSTLLRAPVAHLASAAATRTHGRMRILRVCVCLINARRVAVGRR